MLNHDLAGAMRRAVAAQRRLFAETTTIPGRTVYEGVGEGGDHTLKIDRQCEDAVFEELEKLHADGAEFTVVSEERGEVVFGDGSSPWHVIVDPIDGSLNARRTMPPHSVSIAVASGPTMADVEWGFVHDFGADDEFLAARGKGAELNGRPVRAEGPSYGLEVIGLESADPERIAPVVEALQGKAYRIRAIGSIAITLSYVAAGRLDAMLSARGCRSVDVAAAQLIAREAGARVAFAGLELGQATLDLNARYRVAAGLDDEMLATALEAQSVAGEKG